MTGHGREDLVLLVTNRLQDSAGNLIDRYVRRMLIESRIADAIRLFRTDALSSSVPLKVDTEEMAGPEVVPIAFRSA